MSPEADLHELATVHLLRLAGLQADPGAGYTVGDVVELVLEELPAGTPELRAEVVELVLGLIAAGIAGPLPGRSHLAE